MGCSMICHTSAEIDATYAYLADELNKIGIGYIHLVDHSAGGAPEVPLTVKKDIRLRFKNTLILSGGYDLQRARRRFVIRFRRPRCVWNDFHFQSGFG